MADLISTSPKGDNNSQPVGASPWDDNVPEEEKKKESMPVIGSLDPSDKINEDPNDKPVPFNMPEEVIEEKVGALISASSLFPEAKETPKQDSRMDNTNQQSGGVNELINDSVAPKSAQGPIVATIGTGAKNLDGVASLKSQPAVPESSPSLPPRQTNQEQKYNNTASLKAPEVVAPKKAEGIFSKIFKKKDNKATEKSTAFSPQTPQLGSNSAPQAQATRPNQVGVSIKKAAGKGKVIISKLTPIFGVLVLIVALVFTTEKGILSLGLEKIYGAVGLESLWGGLSANPERALGMSLAKMQGDINFKYSGEINVTIDKTSDSQITKPLVSMATLPIAMSDLNVGKKIAAKLAQYDYYSDYSDTDDTTTSDSTTPTSDSTDYYSDTTADSTTATDATTTDNADTSDSLDSTTTTDSTDIYGSQDAQSGYTAEEGATKVLYTKISGISGREGTEGNITVVPLVGAESLIDLVASSGKIYVKSDKFDFGGKNDLANWQAFSLDSTNSNNPFLDVLNYKSDSGLSVTGSRSGNEKVGKTRCFKYRIDSLQIGDSLADIGITSDMVNSISGNVWIGISDHLIRRAELSIEPGNNSTVTDINIKLDFSDFGIKNSIAVPENSVAVESQSASGGISSEVDLSVDVTNETAGDRDNTRRDDLKSIKDALLQYKSWSGRYPISNEVVNLSESTSSVYKTIVPRYLEEMPTDPKDSSGWWYGYKSDGNHFTLSARFENVDDPETTEVSPGVLLHYVWDNR